MPLHMHIYIMISPLFIFRKLARITLQGLAPSVNCFPLGGNLGRGGTSWAKCSISCNVHSIPELFASPVPSFVPPTGRSWSCGENLQRIPSEYGVWIVHATIK